MLGFQEKKLESLKANDGFSFSTKDKSYKFSYAGRGYWLNKTILKSKFKRMENKKALLL